MYKVDYEKEIWEGWRVMDFIEEIQGSVLAELSIKSIKTKKELKEFIKGEQPYYKKHIPDVYNHFLNILQAMKIKLD